MYIDFSSLFHRSSKDLRDKGHVNIPVDTSKWPEEWTTVYYKSYPRFPKIKLERHAPKGSYASIIEKRHSTRDFSRTPVNKRTLSQVLLYSCGIIDTSPQRAGQSRAYASGGARFSIEVYPIVISGSKEIPAGLYHYNVKDHALDVLWSRSFSNDDIASLFSYEWIQNASVIFVLTSVFWRNQMKYGERGYRYVLLEAGHISQNVYLAAEAAGIGCCAMGGMQDEKIEKLLDIDGSTESVVHSLILG